MDPLAFILAMSKIRQNHECSEAVSCISWLQGCTYDSYFEVVYYAQIGFGCCSIGPVTMAGGMGVTDKPPSPENSGEGQPAA